MLIYSERVIMLVNPVKRVRVCACNLNPGPSVFARVAGFHKHSDNLVSQY